MSKYVDIEPIISNTKAMKAICDAISIDGIVKRLEEAPTADVAPVVHGEWKYDGYRVCRCSVCGDGLEYLNSYYDPASDFNYCQNCGAKMDEVSDDE